MIQDIRIVGADESRTESDPPPSAMKWIYFRLSETPPREWGDIFAEERRFPRHSMWRRAEVVDAYIRVHCPLRELEMHLKDLQEDVANANQKYRTWSAREEQRRRADIEAEAKDRQEIRTTLGKLKF